MRLFYVARSIATAAVVGVIFFACPNARADEPIAIRCPVPNGASSALAAQDASTRFRFIRSKLADQAKRAVLWSNGWSFFGFAAASEVTVIAGLESDPKKRIIWLANGLPALGFPGLVLVDPIKVIADDRELENLAKDDPLEKKLCGNLARAEMLFADDAADEKKKTGVFSHLLCVLANVASSAVIVIGTGEWGSAITNFVGGEAVSELNLYSLPTGAASAIDRYRAGDLTIPNSVRMATRGLSFSLSW
jgi:hypothetical protein